MEKRVDDKLVKILQNVRKPGRYIGEEVNSVKKMFKEGRVSFALAYPDAYEIGMSYLGLRILYHLLNEQEDVVCERVFAPWVDMENELVSHGVKLFSLESKTDIDKFDIVGFSLSYELTFTNVLNMLHLSGISVRSQDRQEHEPIIVAGGACCFNPEPMSAFIDAFVIGDGEDVVLSFVRTYSECKKNGMGRREILNRISRLEGVYVPSLYDAEYSDSKFERLIPKEGVTAVIKKNLIKDLETSYYPVKQIIPLVRIVHDRIAIEIMRGCPNKCRFCQASVINHPVRIRSTGRIKEISRKAYKNTGCESIALLSLSSVNYPYLTDVVSCLTEEFEDKGVGISIPSLRVDEAFYELPKMISAIHKAGLTFAPESAVNEIRRSIGKEIDVQVLCRSVLLAFRNGWRRIKLYFMIGFPSDKGYDEAGKMIGLAKRLSGLKKEVSKGAAEVKISVNPFVPKAHTPLQWLGMKREKEILSVKRELMAASSRKIKIDVSDVKQSMLEACMSRGDRRIGDVIYGAWKNGAKMDSWSEHFNFDIWKRAFKHKGLDIEDYACRKYNLDDILPWEHICTGVSKEYLREELLKSGLYSQK